MMEFFNRISLKSIFGDGINYINKQNQLIIHNAQNIFVLNEHSFGSEINEMNLSL